MKAKTKAKAKARGEGEGGERMREANEMAKAMVNIKISDDLLPLLDGMESQNWSTNISKNNVKTITVTFKVNRAMSTVCTK